MTCLAGLDVSGANVNTLSAATEAQPLRPKLFLAKTSESANASDDIDRQESGVAAQFVNDISQHRALWRARDVPDPAVGRCQDAIAAELDAIVLRARKLLSKAPDSAMANARLACALLNAGQINEAAQAATQASTLPLRDVPAAFMAVQVLLQTGHRETAEALAMRISETNEAEPTSGIAVALRCLAAALAAERGDLDIALLRLEDVAGPQAHALRGYLLLELTQTQRALHELRMARNVSRVETPALLSNLAYAYAVLGSPAKAIRAARQALVVSPGNHLALKHLAGYLLAVGRPTDAVSILRQTAGPHDDLPFDLATALASALLQAGDPKGALRVLRETAQRARFRQTDPVERAELRASAAFLEFRLRKLSRQQRLDIIRTQRDLADGRSILIACMLADVLASRAGRAEVMQAYERLRAIYSAKQLLPLRARLASLAGDLDEQLRLVREWAQVMPLDIDALTAEVYLLCEFQDYRTAASQGLAALRRFPDVIMLRNNTAYALALAGDIKRARRVLNSIAGANSYTIATAGLILLRRGRIQEGLEQYRKAAKAVSNEAVDAEYAAQHVAQLALHLRLVLMELDLQKHPLMQADMMSAPKLNPVWFDEPSFMALTWRAKRLSLPWPPVTGT
jgi:tetratricopeptide (TPR) repeat protein